MAGILPFEARSPTGTVPATVLTTGRHGPYTSNHGPGPLARHHASDVAHPGGEERRSSFVDIAILLVR
jgi:hypothetical protein